MSLGEDVTFWHHLSKLVETETIFLAVAVTVAVVLTTFANNDVGHKVCLYAAAILCSAAGFFEVIVIGNEHLLICHVIQVFALVVSISTAQDFVSEEIPRYPR